MVFALNLRNLREIGLTNNLSNWHPTTFLIVSQLQEVLHALIYLQQNLYLHRDIKGSNILLTEQCEVKLVDYGISCQVYYVYFLSIKINYVYIWR